MRAATLLLAGPNFPWSEDAAGHVYKSLVLVESLQAGEGVPVLFPGWYAGSESFRYWPHFPYFLLAIPLALVPGNFGLAVSAVVLGGLAAGGAGVLLWGRRLGWPLAILGAVLAALLADPLRVAFAEGNVPRVVAHALLLPELALALAVVRADRWHPWQRPAFALIAVATASVLCHPMMAAAAAAGIGLVLAAGSLTGRWPWRRTFAVAGLIAIGTALAGWWLLPSLGGGIAGTNSEAVRRGLFTFDPRQAAEGLAGPFVRSSSDRADFHVGIALVVAAVAAIAYGGRRGSGWVYLVPGLALVAVVFDPLAWLYLRLPFANLLWPIRLQSVGQVLILLGLLHAAADLLQGRRLRRPRLAGAVATALLLLLATETAGNLVLVAGREIPAEMIVVRDRLAASPGWREATLDLGGLGSPPTLLWRDHEQLFGWGIQGARNIAEIVDLNETIERDLTPSFTHRLDWWGVDDAVLDRADPAIEGALTARGFALRGIDGPLRHYGRAGAPRGFSLAPEMAIAVGRNVRAWTPLFPQIVRAPTEFVDDLSLEDLRGARALILAWPRWHDRARAEALVRAYAAAGGLVVVELAGGRSEQRDGTNEFLGVEAIRSPFGAGGFEVEGPAGAARLQTFAPSEGDWLATRLEGEIVPTGTVVQADGAVVLGTAPESERIVFVGLNLAFHAFLTGDPAAFAILVRSGGLAPDATAIGGTVPLRDYGVRGATYRFRVTLDRAQRVVVPIARHERMAATVDGAPVAIGALNDSVVLELPAGEHTVRLTVDEGGSRLVGFAVGGLAVVAAAGLVVLGRRRTRRDAGIRVPGWSVRATESQRVPELGVGGPGAATVAGPFLVVLAEITNLARIPKRFDPAAVALVDARGVAHPLATAETTALARTLGQVAPGDTAPPKEPRTLTLVYAIPAEPGTYELVPASEVARLT